MILSEIKEMLGCKINLPEIRLVVRWGLEDRRNQISLFDMIGSREERVAINALWCLTHLQKCDGAWLQSQQNGLIDMLLAEQHVGRKRMLLQLLREQSYDRDTIRADFLDYCFSKINSECEPYAIRCFCMYCAFKMCRSYPELIRELEEHLEMLSFQAISPGLGSALRTTRNNIRKIMRK